jgi:hypothetical protein
MSPTLAAATELAERETALSNIEDAGGESRHHPQAAGSGVATDLDVLAAEGLVESVRALWNDPSASGSRRKMPCACSRAWR